MVWWFGVGFGLFGNGLGWLGVVWDGLRRFGVGLEWFEKCWGAKAQGHSTLRVFNLKTATGCPETCPSHGFQGIANTPQKEELEKVGGGRKQY